MITIEGKSKSGGVVIAVAAVVDSPGDLSRVSSALLREGIDALKRGLPPHDQPETVIACDSAATGLVVRLPGVRTVGIAAQSGENLPGAEFGVPCVTDLPNLIASISDGDILIVDGNRGVVYVDPDPPTLVHYQRIEQEPAERPKLFISSEHIPARTQSGETVAVYALVTSESDLARGLDEGADGLLVDVRSAEAERGGLFAAALQAAAGKPVSFAVGFVSDELLRAAIQFSRPGQVTALFSLDTYRAAVEEARASLRDAAIQACLLDLEPPEIGLGVFARQAEYVQSGWGCEESALALDLRRSPYLGKRVNALADALPTWVGPRRAEDVLVVIGKHIEAVSLIVRAGARAVAVAPGVVAAAKYAIKEIGPE